MGGRFWVQPAGSPTVNYEMQGRGLLLPLPGELPTSSQIPKPCPLAPWSPAPSHRPNWSCPGVARAGPPCAAAGEGWEEAAQAISGCSEHPCTPPLHLSWFVGYLTHPWPSSQHELSQATDHPWAISGQLWAYLAACGLSQSTHTGYLTHPRPGLTSYHGPHMGYLRLTAFHRFDTTLGSVS